MNENLTVSSRNFNFVLTERLFLDTITKVLDNSMSCEDISNRTTDYKRSSIRSFISLYEPLDCSKDEVS